MPAILDFLYKEFCRARLAEMRKQLLLARKQPGIFRADDDVFDPDGTDRTDGPPPEEWTRVRK